MSTNLTLEQKRVHDMINNIYTLNIAIRKIEKEQSFEDLNETQLKMFGVIKDQSKKLQSTLTQMREELFDQ